MELDSNMGSCGCSGIDNDDDDDMMISPGQKKEQKAREQFLKQSVRDMNALYEALAPNKGMRIKPEESYWIVEAKPEKKNEKE
jgi:hypothetical protein